MRAREYFHKRHLKGLGFYVDSFFVLLCGHGGQLPLQFTGLRRLFILEACSQKLAPTFQKNHK